MKRDERGLGSVGWGVVTLIAVIVVGFGAWGASVALAPIFGAGNAYKSTETGDYRIANYDKFFNDCNNIVGLEGKIKIANDTLSTDLSTGADAGTVLKDKQNLQALKNVRLEAVAQYNADASKNKTRAKFKDAGLPTRIYEDGVTSCG